MMTTDDKQRLDKWLWAARFYKTRSLATAAIEGGKVQVNGDRVKSSRTIKIGDNISVSRDQLKMDVVIRGLNLQRRSATEAQQLYEETVESIERREQKKEANRLLDNMMTQPSRKPGKKDRRRIAKFLDDY
ncbi:MAG: RNA-binding protein [Gammaproteobacteria bacterium]|nr:RNA-binding protein [Gammaproteobacteria bacterium]